MAERHRKPLRQRVAERKAAERGVRLPGEKAGSGMAPRSEPLTEEEENAILWWRRLAMFGTTLQWAALIAVIVEGYLLWMGDEVDPARWNWIIGYGIVFALGRVAKMVGAAQAKIKR